VNRQRGSASRAGLHPAELALAGNTIIWGSTFILVKAALLHVGPLLFLTLRFSLAAVVLAAVFRKQLHYAAWRTVAAGALAGVFLFAGYLLQTLGLQLTTAPKSAFLTGLMSVVVPLLGSLVYRTRPQLSEVLGIALATGGLALMTGLFTFGGQIGSVNRGDILTFLCAIAFAAHIVTLGHFSEQMKFEVLSVSQIAAAALLSLSLLWRVETPHVEWRPVVVGAILITGILATALAFTVQAWAQRHTSSTRTALIYMLEPVAAWVTSFVVMGEGLSGPAATGAALIIGGIVLVELKPLNARQHPS
jgi:drug/metabolite transporter (DMT)-like permease